VKKKTSNGAPDWGAVHRVRLGHARRLLLHRYGTELPDDGAGSEDLRILLHVTAGPLLLISVLLDGESHSSEMKHIRASNLFGSCVHAVDAIIWVAQIVGPSGDEECLVVQDYRCCAQPL
jgi:hypothetical protein